MTPLAHLNMPRLFGLEHTGDLGLQADAALHRWSSNQTLPELIALLQSHGVNAVADVRSIHLAAVCPSSIALSWKLSCQTGR